VAPPALSGRPLITRAGWDRVQREHTGLGSGEVQRRVVWPALTGSHLAGEVDLRSWCDSVTDAEPVAEEQRGIQTDVDAGAAQRLVVLPLRA